ncbi:MAG: phage head-tail joining protein [Hyphomonas sp.]
MDWRVQQLLEFRASLQEARFQGVRSVRDQSGEEITYKSDSEMAGALAALDRELAALRGSRSSAIVYINAHKGI